MTPDAIRETRPQGRGDSVGRVLGVVVVVALALWVTELQMTYTPLLREDRSNLERTMEGTADRPFCYRVLVPWVTAALAQLIPDAVGDRVCSEPAAWSVCRYMPAESAKRPPYFALAIVLFWSLMAYAVILGRMYRRLFNASEKAVWMVAVGSLAVLVLIIYFGFCGHIYDFTILALFAAMLSALLQERLRLFLLLFSVSCWTKETTILITFAYCAIYWDRLPRRRLLLHLALQMVAFVVAYGTVRWLFLHNPGGAVENWLSQELVWLGRKTSLKLALLAAAGFAISFKWTEKPAPLRRSLLMLAPHLALFLYGARPGELRNFYESFPVIMLFVFRNVAIGPRAMLSALRPAAPATAPGQRE